jgi:hypothetical protein
MTKKWLLAQEYCAGHSRRMAARAAGVGAHTAGRHFEDFERALANHLRRLLREGQAWKLGEMDKIQGGPRKSAKQLQHREKNRLAAELCFEHLKLRDRLELLFELVFLPRIKRWQGH